MREQVAHVLAGLVRRWRDHARVVDREAVLAQVRVDAPPSHTFVVLTVGAAAIATLGLLLDSPAVIIGAMLVAPFLGPIVALGFSIAMTDVTLALRATKSLLCGVVLGLVTSIAIVKLSPFIPPTQQILARTSPNLFDLLVAVFAGLVGGYAVVHRLGGTIAGVAIATALMPPLAAAGYGLAMGELSVFNGAFYLFLTNLVAIAFSVASCAIWYNFGNLHAPKELVWPTVGAGVVMVLLSVPLVKTLNESVRTTILSRQAGAVLRAALPAADTRLERIAVTPEPDGGVRVAAVVFAREFDGGLPVRLERELAQELRIPVRLELDQLMVGSDAIRAGRAAAAETGEAETRRLRGAIPFPLLVADVSPAQRLARFQLSLDAIASLEAIRYVEAALQEAFAPWRVELLPPLRPLPPVSFPPGEAVPDGEGAKALANAVWALRRWGVGRVAVSGSTAAAEGRNAGERAALAQRRAAHVAEVLEKAGASVELVSTGDGGLERRGPGSRTVRIEVLSGN